MTEHSTSRALLGVLRREFQDHRGAFLWTPLGTALGLLLLFSVALLVIGRFDVASNVALSAILADIKPHSWELTFEGGPQSAEPGNYRVERDSGPVDESLWNFSADWRFKPLEPEQSAVENEAGVSVTVELDAADDDAAGAEAGQGLNPVLYAVHTLFNWTLLAILVSYLLSALFNDRRDGSILYWKSMPLGDGKDVLARLLMALLVVPLLYIAISVATQLLLVGLGLLASLQMGENSVDTLLSELQFAPLFIGQLSGWLLCVPVMLPLFAWLLLASAGARRSPFLLAVTPIVALLLVDRLLVGSGVVSQFLLDHLPRPDQAVQLGQLQVIGVGARSLQPVVLLSGLLLAAAFVAGAVYLRKYRFEL